MPMLEVFIGGFGRFGTMAAIITVSHTIKSKTIEQIVVETLEKKKTKIY